MTNVYVPDPDTSYNDLADTGIFTRNGAPSVAFDLHDATTEKTVNLDGATQYLTTSQKPLDIGDGPTLTLSFFFRSLYPGAIPSVRTVMGQRDTTSEATASGWSVEMNTAANMRVDFFTGGISNRLSIDGLVNPKRDGNENLRRNRWHHVVVVLNGASGTKAYMNGVEVTGISVSTSGAGFTGFTGSIENFSVGATNDGAENFSGAVSRVNFYEGEVLNLAQSEQVWLDEVDAIDIPTEDLDADDMSDTGDFPTQNGSPTFVPDQHTIGSNVMLQNDGSMSLEHDAELITSGDGERHTIEFWYRAVSSPGADFTHVAQGNAGTDRHFVIGQSISGNRFQVVFDSSTTLSHSVQVRVEDADTPKDDQLHHCLVTVDGLSGTSFAYVDVYIDGVEREYDQISHGSPSYSGPPSPAHELTVHKNANGGLQAPSGAELGRLKVWRTHRMSSAEALYRFRQECTSVVIPATSDAYNDFTGGDFTKNGTPTLADDQHAASVTYDLDGVNDNLIKATGTIEHFVNSVASIGWWMKLPVGISTGRIIHERNNSIGGGLQFFFSGTDLLFRAESNGSDTTTSGVASLPYEDGRWHHWLITMETDDINIYVDGLEVSVYSQQDSNAGAGFSGFGTDTATFAVGSRSNSTDFANITPSRIHIWDSNLLHACQIAKEYENECDSVVVPAADFEDFDGMSDGDWTQNNSPSFITDLYGNDAFVGTAESSTALLRRSPVLVNGDGTRHTVSIWFKAPDQTSEAEGSFLLGVHGPAGTDATMYLIMDAGAGNHGRIYWANWSTSGGVGQDSRTNARFDDGNWHHIICVIDGASQIQTVTIDGVRITDFLNETVYGGGYLGPDAGGSKELLVGNRLDIATNTSGSGVATARPEIWRTDDLSICQAIKKYAEQIALILPPNDSPQVDNPIPNQTTAATNAVEDVPYSFQFASNTFSDPDNQPVSPLTYTADIVGGGGLPAWLTFTPATRTFSGTPLNGDIGQINIEVTADDGQDTAVDTFLLDIVANAAPTVDQGITNQNATDGVAFDFIFPADAFDDVNIQNGDVLTYTADAVGGGGLPVWGGSGLSFNAGARQFTGTPGPGDVGTDSIRVTATDLAGNSVFTDFDIVVAVAPSSGGSSSVGASLLLILS